LQRDANPTNDAHHDEYPIFELMGLDVSSMPQLNNVESERTVSHLRILKNPEGKTKIKISGSIIPTDKASKLALNFGNIA
jgi:hypothetical protein